MKAKARRNDRNGPSTRIPSVSRTNTTASAPIGTSMMFSTVRLDPCGTSSSETCRVSRSEVGSADHLPTIRARAGTTVSTRNSQGMPGCLRFDESLVASAFAVITPTVASQAERRAVAAWIGRAEHDAVVVKFDRLDRAHARAVRGSDLDGERPLGKRSMHLGRRAAFERDLAAQPGMGTREDDRFRKSEPSIEHAAQHMQERRDDPPASGGPECQDGRAGTGAVRAGDLPCE